MCTNYMYKMDFILLPHYLVIYTTRHSYIMYKIITRVELSVRLQKYFEPSLL